MVGGHNVVVEVDETFMAVVDDGYAAILFGGTERGSGISFMIPVPDRKAATLLQLIGQHVRPASICGVLMAESEQCLNDFSIG